MDWVVGVSAAGGLILGVINLFWHICRDRVKLKVTCSEGEDGRYDLWVFNNSAFRVKITEVGFILRGGERRGLKTLNHDGIIEARLDRKMEGTIDEITNLPDLAHGVKACYALRADGKLKKGPVSSALNVKLGEAGKAAGSS